MSVGPQRRANGEDAVLAIALQTLKPTRMKAWYLACDAISSRG